MSQIKEVTIKDVFYIRHAKSAWDKPELSDLDRPLNERGHQIAPKMAIFIKNKFKLPDLEIISSPANRAITTANYFAEVFHQSKSDIIIDNNLYFGGELDYLKCLELLKKTTKAVFVFGHNPTIESVVRNLTNPYLGPVPTCSVFHASLNSKTWNISNFNDLRLENYFFPKIVLNQ